MRKIFLIAVVFISSVAISQTTNTDLLNARKGIFLRNYRFDTITNVGNGVNWSNYTKTLPTAKAVHEYVLSAGIGSMAYPPAGIPRSNGTTWLPSINGTAVQFVKGDGSLDGNTYLTSYTETDPLFDTKFAGKTTTNLAEGANLYFTNARARQSLSFTSGVAGYNNSTGVITIPANTSHVSESGNLYFTNARSRSAISLTTTGNSGAATYNNSTGVFNIPNYATSINGYNYSIHGSPFTYNATLTDDYIEKTNGSTINLPTAVGNAGKKYYIKNGTGGTLSISSFGGAVEEGGVIQPIGGDWTTYVSNGTDWKIFGRGTDIVSGSNINITGNGSGTSPYTISATNLGESNTGANLGGGLANYDSKTGNTLRFNSFAASDFDLASNLLSIDATLKNTWNNKENVLTFQHSISRSGNTINLLNDLASPGNNKVYGTDASGVRGWKDEASGGIINSGSYTPTLFNTTNIGASTAYQCNWSRVDSVYTISGEIDIDPTTASTLTVLGISLPPQIITLGGNTSDVSGTASDDLGTVGRLRADTTNVRIEVRFTPIDISNRRFSFICTAVGYAP
ncbi:MAG: hypothetical protein RIQ89_1949 [Bacteroidota bacterium]